MAAAARRGYLPTVSEIGDAENISKSYVSRILRLASLAPDIVEAILAGKTDHALMLEKLERPLPASWEEQRGQLCLSISKGVALYRSAENRRSDLNPAHEPRIGSVDSTRPSDASARRPGALHFPS
jgi:hypothetical protein